MKKAIFHIHGKSAKTTTRIMTRVLQKYKFIKVNLEENKCVISSDQVPDSLNSWIIQRLLKSKIFLGKYHSSHPLFNDDVKTQKQDKYKAAISRFGYWECSDIEEMTMFLYHKRRVELMLTNMPDWQATKQAKLETNYNHEPHDSFKGVTRSNFIEDLVKYHNHTEEEATRVVDREYPHYNIPIPKFDDIEKSKTPEERQERNRLWSEKLQKTIDILKFYTPKERAKYIKDDSRFLEFLMLIALLRDKGRDWFVENVGEIHGIT